MHKLTVSEILSHKIAIDKMDRMSMARARRFLPDGHIYFSHPELTLYFENRFQDLGGMDAELSKKIGWGEKGSTSTVRT